MHVCNTERIISGQYFSKIMIAAHLLAFSGFAVSLLLVNPSPAKQMGYFSFEFLMPLTSWLMLVVLVATSCLLIEIRNRFALPAIILTMFAMRLPLVLMFKLPYEPDSYIYMGIIQKWHQIGMMDLSVDLRARYWPVFFIFTYSLRQLGINELIIWSWGPMALYVVNALLIFLVLRRFLNRKAAMYALLLVSLAPTFNFYYYQVMAPQLLASTILLAALLAFYNFERRRTRKGPLAIFIGLFVLLVLTHHLTTLLLTGYVFLLLFENPLALFLERIGIGSADRPNSINCRNLMIIVIGMLLVWMCYMLLVAQQFSGLALVMLRAAFAGETSTYSWGPYSISTYTFNASSLLVYGFRLVPLAISAFLLLLLWSKGMFKVFHLLYLSAKELRSLTGTLGFGALILFSFVLLKGLFLEIPRIFDLVVLFSSVIAVSAFSQKRVKPILIFKGALLLSLMMVSSTIGMAVHNVEFVYYPQEKQAALYAAGRYSGATLYTDERLLPFVAFFAPNLEVKSFPLAISSILPNGISKENLVLLSDHSVTYDRYRHLFQQSPSAVVQFVQDNGRMVYSNEGVRLYSL